MIALMCAVALAALGMTIRGDAPPPPPPPDIPAVEEPAQIRPALMLPSMVPATIPVRASLIA
jgi:hypothetical protein